MAKMPHGPVWRSQRMSAATRATGARLSPFDVRISGGLVSVILGAAGEVHRSNERNRIIEALTGASEGLRVSEIMALAEFSSRGAVDVLLGKMVKAGEIERFGRGLYRFPSGAGKIGEKERSPSQNTDLIVENNNLTNLINLTSDLSYQPATIGQTGPPRFKDSNEVEGAREL
jgi:hypothetical protein